MNLPLLAASRAVQGAAAALIAPAALSILTTRYSEGPARNRVLGYFGMTASAGFVVGLVAGGVLVDTVGWRGVFFVNVPVCLALAVVGSRALRAGLTSGGPRHLDLPGAALVTAGTAVLVYAPTLGTNDGWTSSPFVGCLLVSAALFGAFVFVESRSRQPLVPLRIFRYRTLVVGNSLSVKREFMSKSFCTNTRLRQRGLRVRHTLPFWPTNRSGPVPRPCSPCPPIGLRPPRRT